ncbi:16S rRNA (uracil(1498)-N(3))-methyltransferase [Thiofilum flexile]|uniref:16S rRNA (uracil(1498)-N(3))-methyltransferase n=1 Tax=Thiofilum flexile TaxID=125627 RepID=UPI00035F3A38|nr:16S rRNA (uracil(1498)-N(3))-methyltransferase [Thiofilum flexile]
MRIPRFYCPIPLQAPATLELPEATYHHAIQVLRLNVGEELILFNGQTAGEYLAVIESLSRRSATVRIQSYQAVERESPLPMVLALAIIKPDKMDFALQKAVELGVTAIQPLLTERSVIRVLKDKQDKKLQHWEGVLMAACEQSGRTTLPLLKPPLSLNDYLAQTTPYERLILSPTATNTFSSHSKKSGVEVIIGPEGGFTEEEVALCTQTGVSAISLGPRILRAETACISALTLIQHYYGDLAEPNASRACCI